MGRPEQAITVESEDNSNKPKSLSLAEKFARVVDAATDTEIYHVALRDMLAGQVYFRFNPFLREYFPMDEVRPEKIAEIREDSHMYIRRNHNRIIEACDQLLLPRSPADRVKDFLRQANEMARARLMPAAKVS